MAKRGHGEEGGVGMKSSEQGEEDGGLGRGDVCALGAGGCVDWRSWCMDMVTMAGRGCDWGSQSVFFHSLH